MAQDLLRLAGKVPDLEGDVFMFHLFHLTA